MSKAELEQPRAVQAATGWRIKVGFAFFIYGLIGNPLLIAILTLIGGTKFAVISGGLIVFGEVMLVAGAAIAGKQGYAYIKATVFGYLKKAAPPREVSKIRYTFGLVLFFTPAVHGWSLPYHIKHIPWYLTHPTIYAIIGDVMMVVGLFLLGGDFWDKLRSLFVQSSTVVFEEKPTA